MVTILEKKREKWLSLIYLTLRSQFFVYEQKLFTCKTYPSFVTLDKGLRDLWPEQILRQTDKQTLKRQITTMGSPGKQNLSNVKKYYENRNTCSKVVFEHTLYIYIYM